MINTPEIHDPVQQYSVIQDVKQQRSPFWKCWFGQLVRFGLVGGTNTLLDLLIFNSLLWLFPTSSLFISLGFNSIAYSVGAVNSFLLNKYWTFQHRQSITAREVSRFVITTLLGIGCNDLLLWCANILFYPLTTQSLLWVNVSKVMAIAGTVLISYLGMRLWVFTNRPEQCWLLTSSPPQATRNAILDEHLEALIASLCMEGVHNSMSKQISLQQERTESKSGYSLSLVLPVYNEEQVIAHTISDLLDIVPAWTTDFEVIVVNDGSFDHTASILEALYGHDPHVRIITHPVNQGYGAALVSGFAAATKELTFFMDSDGQFDIRDLATFFPFLDVFDAVIGYRRDRQDTWMRKLNAWGWKQAVRLVLGIQVRDLDCAFKLLPTDFLHAHPLQTRGAMINAELLYTLRLAGCSYKEVGVRHLPRRGGRATGAKLTVIIRAFKELFVAARRWKRERHTQTQVPRSHLHKSTR